MLKIFFLTAYQRYDIFYHQTMLMRNLSVFHLNETWLILPISGLFPFKSPGLCCSSLQGPEVLTLRALRFLFGLKSFFRSETGPSDTSVILLSCYFLPCFLVFFGVETSVCWWFSCVDLVWVFFCIFNLILSFGKFNFFVFKFFDYWLKSIAISCCLRNSLCLCMYECVHMCMCVYEHVCMFQHACVCMNMQVCVCTHVCLCLYACVNLLVWRAEVNFGYSFSSDVIHLCFETRFLI